MPALIGITTISLKALNLPLGTLQQKRCA